jgi:hypothetical protein
MSLMDARRRNASALRLRTAFEVISGPLSDRMCSGTPRISMTSAITSSTPKLLLQLNDVEMNFLSAKSIPEFLPGHDP